MDDEQRAHRAGRTFVVMTAHVIPAKAAISGQWALIGQGAKPVEQEEIPAFTGMTTEAGIDIGDRAWLAEPCMRLCHTLPVTAMDPHAPGTTPSKRIDFNMMRRLSSAGAAGLARTMKRCEPRRALSGKLPAPPENPPPAGVESNGPLLALSPAERNHSLRPVAHWPVNKPIQTVIASEELLARVIQGDGEWCDFPGGVRARFEHGLDLIGVCLSDALIVITLSFDRQRVVHVSGGPMVSGATLERLKVAGLLRSEWQPGEPRFVLQLISPLAPVGR